MSKLIQFRRTFCQSHQLMKPTSKCSSLIHLYATTKKCQSMTPAFPMRQSFSSCISWTNHCYRSWKKWLKRKTKLKWRFYAYKIIIMKLFVIWRLIGMKKAGKSSRERPWLSWKGIKFALTKDVVRFMLQREAWIYISKRSTTEVTRLIGRRLLGHCWSKRLLKSKSVLMLLLIFLLILSARLLSKSRKEII